MIISLLGESAADYTGNSEFLQYDFISIRAATNGFDKANKLGRGGFGNVYKVINNKLGQT